MYISKWASGILMLALVFVSSRAWAEVNSEVGIWGVALAGGFNTHAMTDVNNSLGTNSGGYTDINSGEQAGLEAKYRLAENWGLGLEANYLIVGNTVNQNLTGNGPGVGNSIGSQTVNLGAIEYLANASYIFPSVARGLDLRIGVGLGFAMLNGADIAYNANSFAKNNLGFSSYTENLSGSGFDGKLFAGADYYFMPSLSLGLALGFRYAKLLPISYSVTPPGGSPQSGTWQNSSGTDLAVDYSGLNTQLALTWWIH